MSGGRHPAGQPRELPPGLTEQLWQRLRLRATRLILRKVPVGVEVARDDIDAGHGDRDDSEPRQLRITIRNGTPVVTVVGDPAELTMWAFGRTTAAQVRLEGAAKPVQTLTETRWRL